MQNKKEPYKYLPLNIEGKVPPQAIDIEEAILAALLIDPLAFLRVSNYFDDETIFYKDSHRLIIKAIKQLYEAKIGIDLLTVTDRLRSNGDLDEIGGILALTKLSSSVQSSAHVEFHCMVLTDKLLLRELIRIGQEMQQKAFAEEDPDEIAEWAEMELNKRFDLDIEGRASFKDALHATLLDIANKSKGIVSAFITTGDPEIDEKIAFRERQICLIAGAEGSGKTKYVTYIARKILDNNPGIRVLWFSMEDSTEQIIRSFISMDVKLTTRQLQSINYELSEKDHENITITTDNFKKYNIDFIDHVCTINTIARKSKLLRDKFKDDQLVIIVDNLGLITTDSFFKSIEKDDFLAGRLKEICDQTDACMFVLHHITKDAARKFNIKEGYRPRKEYIKGSTRILDYVQQAVLVNLPRKYDDLLTQEKNKSQLFNFNQATGTFDKTRFIMEFWSMNPHGDKNTRTIPDLLESTWTALKFECAAEKMLDGSPLRVGYLMNKYVEYSIYIDDKNQDREQQYHTERMSIYSFIENKKYKEDFRPKPNSRTFYLYGNDMKLTKEIDNLFIVEAIKNRDGNTTEGNNIIRYISNLDYNHFQPIIDDKWEELKNTGTNILPDPQTGSLI